MCLNKRWQLTEDNSYLNVFSDRPLSFDVISEGMNPSMNGTLAGALSGDGITFWAAYEPKMNSVISVELNDRMIANCTEVEKDMLRFDHSVVGKVSSVERNELSSEVIVKMTFLKRNGAMHPAMSRSSVAELV